MATVQKSLDIGGVLLGTSATEAQISGIPYRDHLLALEKTV